MSLIDDLRADAIRRLQVDVVEEPTNPDHAHPHRIAIGEHFSVAFTVRNTDPSLRFKNVELHVVPLGHVTPIMIPFDTPHELGPNESFTRTWVFRAEAARENLSATEPYARIEVHADADVTDLLKALISPAKVEYIDISPPPQRPTMAQAHG